MDDNDIEIMVTKLFTSPEVKQRMSKEDRKLLIKALQTFKGFVMKVEQINDPVKIPLPAPDDSLKMVLPVPYEEACK